MFTVKAIAKQTNGRTFGYEATNYAIGPDYSVEFWNLHGPNAITLYAKHYERIVIENDAGRTVENIVAPPRPADIDQRTEELLIRASVEPDKAKRESFIAQAAALKPTNQD